MNVALLARHGQTRWSASPGILPCTTSKLHLQAALAQSAPAQNILLSKLFTLPAVYWRKLYLRRDFGAADPRLFAPACLFLAAKTGASGLGGRQQLLLLVRLHDAPTAC